MHGSNNNGAAEPIKLMCLNNGNHLVKLHGAFNARNELVTVEARALGLSFTRAPDQTPEQFEITVRDALIAGPCASVGMKDNG
ncbi:MAG: hypothetical protein WA733_25575 [Methylocystis sp.]